MSYSELLANLDIVNYPDDKTVLLGHTSQVYSVGLIKMNFQDKALVVSLLERIDINKMAGFSSIVNALGIIVAETSNDAFDIAVSNINAWLTANSEEKGILTIDDFTAVDKDAKPFEPDMRKMKDFSPLKGKDHLAQEQKLGRIVNSSFRIPIKPIIDAVSDSLD